MSVGDLDRADTRYETAEAAVLTVLRAGASGEELVAPFEAAARAAEELNAAAYAELHRSVGERRAELDYLTEVTEVLSELWRDIADAAAEGNR